MGHGPHRGSLCTTHVITVGRAYMLVAAASMMPEAFDAILLFVMPPCEFHPLLLSVMNDCVFSLPESCDGLFRPELDRYGYVDNRIRNVGQLLSRHWHHPPTLTSSTGNSPSYATMTSAVLRVRTLHHDRENQHPLAPSSFPLSPRL